METAVLPSPASIRAESFYCRVADYEGPLELLVALVRRHEVDIFRLVLRDILEQLHALCSPQTTLSLDAAADALAMGATLLLLKARELTLLGPHPAEEDPEPTSLAVLKHLLAYCRLRDLCSLLEKRQAAQQQVLRRPAGLAAVQQTPVPMETVSIEELPRILRELHSRLPPSRVTIQDEPLLVATVIEWSRAELAKGGPVPLLEWVAQFGASKEAWVVCFLGLLELLRQGVSLGRQQEGEGPTQYLLFLSAATGSAEDLPREL